MAEVRLNEVEKVAELGRAFWKDFQSTKERMDELSEWDSLPEIVSNMKAVAELFGRGMVCVEQAAKELNVMLSSAEKRSAAAKVLDSMVKLPGFAELVDGPVFEYGLGFIAGLWNAKAGHLWPLR